jgi:CheY-like chemotaxis protein
LSRVSLWIDAWVAGDAKPDRGALRAPGEKARVAMPVRGDRSFRRASLPRVRPPDGSVCLQGSHRLSEIGLTPPADPAPAPSSPTIVVVDDERSVRSLIRLLLEGAGYRVVEAANGEAGLAAVAACDAVLVVTDVMMPVMNGREMIARLRSDASTAAIPIVVISAEANIATLRADAAIPKPFENGDLTATVKALLEGAG